MLTYRKYTEKDGVIAVAVDYWHDNGYFVSVWTERFTMPASGVVESDANEVVPLW